MTYRLLRSSGLVLLPIAWVSLTAKLANGQPRPRPTPTPTPVVSPPANFVRIYNPITIQPGVEISDTLTNQDIPTGERGFFRDYVVELTQGDQVTIDVASDTFDTLVLLINNDGNTIGQNDDDPSVDSNGTTNSLLFLRIRESGRYYIRVRSFTPTGSGPFRLKVTRLVPVN